MDVPTVRKTCTYQLQPTAEQEETMAVVLRRCRELYNAALTERREAWRRRRVSSTVAGQSAQLPDIKQERPEYQAIHSPVWQDVLTRLDRACQAFFRRVQHGEQPGLSPRPAGRPLRQLHRPAIRQWAPLDTGCLALSKIGRLALRWSRPLQGTPKTVTIRRAADGWYACCSCDRPGARQAAAPDRPRNRD
jgi:putative transposase